MVLARMVIVVIGIVGWSAASHAMSFSFAPIVVNNCTTDCPKAIVAEGEIYYDDVGTLVETLRAGIERDKNIKPLVVLSSVGGNVYAGYQIGRIFRAINATVVVGRAVRSGSGYSLAPGVCASACVFSLMGGKKRFVPDGSRIGVHWMSGPTPQVFSGNVALPEVGRKSDDNESEANLRQFMRSMGVRPDFARFIRNVPNSSMHVMTPQEITRFGLAQTRFR
jgi:hypothetical protein